MRKFIFFLLILTVVPFVSVACDSENDGFVEDVIIKVDTITVADTTFSTNDTIIVTDTIISVDTIINNGDTIIKNGTIIKVDTIVKQDTIIKVDTIVNTDTLVFRPLDITLYMEQHHIGTGSLQAADCYNDYLFQFQDTNDSVFIYDLDRKKYIQSLHLPKDYSNHCNNVSFSRIYLYEGDLFPLLYVSGSGKGTYNQVQVYHITKESESFTITKVQDIVLPTANSTNNLYWTNVAIDNENGYMYVYANGDNKGQIAKFNIPPVNIAQIKLNNNDIIEQFTVSLFEHQQGGYIKDDILHIITGVPHMGDRTNLRMIDLKRKNDLYFYNISELGFPTIEFESLSSYKDGMISAANGNMGLGIYYIKIKSRE